MPEAGETGSGTGDIRAAISDTMSDHAKTPISTAGGDRTPPTAPPGPDMIWIPGGTFRMGSEKFSHRLPLRRASERNRERVSLG